MVENSHIQDRSWVAGVADAPGLPLPLQRPVTPRPSLFCHWVIGAITDGSRLGPRKLHLLKKKKRRGNSEKRKQCGGASSCQFRPAQMCLSGREDPAHHRLEGAGGYFPGSTDVGGENRLWTGPSNRADLSCFPIGLQTAPPWVGALPLLLRDACVTNTSTAMVLLRACGPPHRSTCFQAWTQPILPRCLLPRLPKGELLVQIKGTKMLSSSCPSARLRAILCPLA